MEGAAGAQEDARGFRAKTIREFDKARKVVDMWEGPDPDRYWAQMSHTKRALNLVAVGIGGFVE